MNNDILAHTITEDMLPKTVLEQLSFLLSNRTEAELAAYGADETVTFFLPGEATLSFRLPPDPTAPRDSIEALTRLACTTNTPQLLSLALAAGVWFRLDIFGETPITHHTTEVFSISAVLAGKTLPKQILPNPTAFPDGISATYIYGSSTQNEDILSHV